MATTALKLGRQQYPSFIAQHQPMVLINLKKRKKDT